MERDVTDGRRYLPWFGTYRVRRGFSPRAKRVWAVVLVFLGAFLVYRTAARVAQGGWLVVVEALFSPLTVAIVLLVLQARRPMMTRVDAGGLTARPDLFRTRSVPWSLVARVQSAGRFEDHPVAVLVDGTRLLLPGLTASAADAMAAVDAPVQRREPQCRG